jgi:FkbM family methyltransferase
MKIVKSIFRSMGIDVVRYHTIPPHIHYLRSLDIRTVLDVGASIGDSAVEYRHYFPDAIIHSFEPVQECFEKLQKCLSDKRFFAHHTALGNQTGKAIFFRNSHTPSSSFLQVLSKHVKAFPYTGTTTQITVPITRLDAIWPQLAAEPRMVCKIDVQGFEDRVLKGAQKVLQKVAAVIIETSFVPLYQNQALFDDVYRLLYTHHFRYMGNVHDIRDPNTGMPLQANALFVAERFL